MRGRDAIAITLVATVMTMAVVLFFARPAYPAPLPDFCAPSALLQSTRS